jgi:hypothetical protein
MAGTISMGARREVLEVMAERYRAVGRREKGLILDELCKDALMALWKHLTGCAASGSW